MKPQPARGPAARWFFWGRFMLFFLGAGHLGGFAQAVHAARTDPKLLPVTAAMRDAQQTLMGFSPSILDFREFFSLTFSLLVLTLALVLGTVEPDSRAGVRASRIVAVAFAVVAVAGLFFSVVQAVVTGVAISLLFAAASAQVAKRVSPASLNSAM